MQVRRCRYGENAARAIVFVSRDVARVGNRTVCVVLVQIDAGR